MKTLLVVRHAKSSWDSPGMADFDRPLNGRGKKDAPEMARRLLRLKINIDVFVSSPANRAKSTASYFITEYGRKEKEIVLVPALYHALTETFYQTVAGIDNQFSSAALFSHNPGITDFVNTLTQVNIDNMPTCGVFAVTIKMDHWSEFARAPKELLLFDYPKSGVD